ncbi:MAG: cytochrome c oxidase subunit 3 [Alphaproteobacteria bacterium]|nr:cytochrome c oxidase subunit 3 [Alphaproteobacteria bacterium]
MEASANHNFHILEPSPWPFSISMSLLVATLGATFAMHGHEFGIYLASTGVLGIVGTLYCWWRDVIIEGRIDKAHSSPVQHGLRIGVALFILSEVAFFFAFFWSLFKAWLDPVMLLNAESWPEGLSTWPPKGIKTLDPWDIPFINTLILLLSGTTVTWAHYAIEDGNKDETVKALGISVVLGVIFSILQAYEYHHASFSLNDGIYPSNFYLTTGFHGIHVIIGTIFLFVCLVRASKGHFEKGNGHLGFEFAAWYWHFVDVVWLFLFVFLYILPS